MAPRPRLLVLPVLLALSLITACKKTGRLDLLLRPAEDLDLPAIEELEVRLLDDRDGRELERATVAGADLETLPNVMARSGIDPEVPYVFEVRAEVPTDVCASGRVVGRSLPVQVEGDDTEGSATMYVACADAFAPTGSLRAARAGHAAIWAPQQGGALVLGGASEVRTAATLVTALDSVERYDPATGSFTELTSMLEARFLPSAALDANGRVVVMGGADDGLGEVRHWLDTVEEIDGETRRAKGLLDSKWVRGAPLPLADGTLALLGLGVHGVAVPVQATFYDPATETNARGYLMRGENDYNAMAIPMAGRERALLVGAVAAPGVLREARPSLFCANGCCEEPGPCFVSLGSDDDPVDDTGAHPAWGAGLGWKDAAGAWLACPAGGGTVTITGGHLGDTGPALDGVWCYHDAPGEPSTEGLVRIGSLAHPRLFHGMVAVRPGRLLVVGGTAGTADSIEQAEILRVDPCSCEPLDDGDVTEVVVDPSLGHLGRLLFGGSEVVLGDGTVLVTGAAAADAAFDLAADNDAWVFMPDLPD